MRIVRIAVALALIPGCKASRQEDHHPEAELREEAAHDHEGRDGGQAEMVHVDPAMLRDLRVTTAPVELRPAGEAASALGEIAVNEDRYAEISAPIAAQVTRVLAAAGEAVKVGQPLVELYSAGLGRAKASLTAAEAREAVARKTLERKRALAAEGVVAPREAQQAEAELAAAEAEAGAARSELSAVGMAPSGGTARFILKAPLEGTVIDRNAVAGRTVDPAQPLFRIADLSRLWLVVQSFERDAVRIRIGSEARVTLAALPGKTFQAQVSFIGARVDPTSRTIPIRLELQNPEGALRPGMSASASIPVGEEGARVTTVPATALQRLDDGWYVFLPSREEGAFERRAVGRGRTLGGEVEILSGLHEGEKVVVEGAFLLKAELDKARGGGEAHEH